MTGVNRRSVLAAAVAGAAGLTGLGALPAGAAGRARAAGGRVVVYYQTQYADDDYVSPLGLTEHATGATHVIVAAVHLNDVGGPHPPVTVNDDPPEAEKYAPMWRDLDALRAAGVPVLAMVGGAAQGSFTRLDSVKGLLAHNMMCTTD